MSDRLLLWVDLRRQKISLNFFRRIELRPINLIHTMCFKIEDVPRAIAKHRPVAIACIVSESGGELAVREVAQGLPVYSFAEEVCFENWAPGPLHGMTLPDLFELLARDFPRK